MYKATIQLGFILLLSTLANPVVAAKQRGFPEVEIPEGKAAIYLYRKKGSGGMMVKHRFYVNQEWLIPIGNRGCSVAFVDPGKSLIRLESGGFAGALIVWTERMFTDPFLVLNLDADAGKSYFLEFVLGKTDTLAPKAVGHSLFLVPQADGLGAASKCAYRPAIEIVKDAT